MLTFLRWMEFITMWVTTIMALIYTALVSVTSIATQFLEDDTLKFTWFTFLLLHAFGAWHVELKNHTWPFPQQLFHC